MAPVRCPDHDRGSNLKNRRRQTTKHGRQLCGEFEGQTHEKKSKPWQSFAWVQAAHLSARYQQPLSQLSLGSCFDCPVAARGSRQHTGVGQSCRKQGVEAPPVLPVVKTKGATRLQSQLRYLERFIDQGTSLSLRRAQLGGAAMKKSPSTGSLCGEAKGFDVTAASGRQTSLRRNGSSNAAAALKPGRKARYALPER